MIDVLARLIIEQVADIAHVACYGSPAAAAGAAHRLPATAQHAAHFADSVAVHAVIGHLVVAKPEHVKSVQVV